jgi:hypothetical protein
LESKRLFPRAQVIHGPRQLVGPHGERLGFAVFVFEFGKVLLARLVVAQEEPGRLRNRPAQVHGADLLARDTPPRPSGFLGALHQTTIRDEILHAREAGDVLNLLQTHQRQNLPDAGHGLSAGEGLDLVRLSCTGDLEFPLAQQLVIVSAEGHLHRDRLAHAGLGEVLLHPFAVGFGGQLLADHREVVLAVGILHVGSEVGALAHQVTATAQQVPGGAQLSGIGRGWGQHPAAQQDRNLARINFIVLGFAPVDGFHREGMAQDKGTPFLPTEIRQPLPGEDALDCDDEIVTVRSDDTQKGLGRGGQILMDPDRAALIEDTDVQGAGR